MATGPDSKGIVEVRDYRAEDCPLLLELFCDTVRRVNIRDYTVAEIEAWAAGTAERQAWELRLKRQRSLVAERDGRLLGFASLRADGYLDLLYVQADVQGQGIGSTLCAALERGSEAPRLFTHSSRSARAFFEGRGYRLVQSQFVERGGQRLENYLMERQLERMPESQKMRCGLLYDANNDVALKAQRRQAKELCHEFNQLRPSECSQQEALLRRLLGHVGKNIEINAPFFCDYGKQIFAGENFYCNHHTVILDGARVSFGDNVFIGPNCCFSTAGHPLDAGQRNRGLEYAYPIRIGDNVWFGASVTVLPGVEIGSNTVIGAGSVVSRSIPSAVVAAGNPCRVLRSIGPEDKKKYGPYTELQEKP